MSEAVPDRRVRVVDWVRRTVVPRRVLFLTSALGLGLVTVLTVAGGEV